MYSRGIGSGLESNSDVAAAEKEGEGRVGGEGRGGEEEGEEREWRTR